MNARVRPTSPLEHLVRRLQLLEPGDMLTCADYDALGDAIDEIERLREALKAIRDTKFGYQDQCWKIATDTLGEGEKTWV